MRHAKARHVRVSLNEADGYGDSQVADPLNTRYAEVYRGGGFTDLRPVFEHARALHPPPAAVIYLTDGYGEAPAEMEFPTLWVLTKEGKRPAEWGVELRLDA